MRKWIIVFTVVLSAMIELLDPTIVNVSLPHVMGNLGATLDEITWVVTAYVFANVIVVPMTSWLAIVFGRRNYFVGSIILYSLSLPSSAATRRPYGNWSCSASCKVSAVGRCCRPRNRS